MVPQATPGRPRGRDFLFFPGRISRGQKSWATTSRGGGPCERGDARNMAHLPAWQGGPLAAVSPPAKPLTILSFLSYLSHRERQAVPAEGDDMSSLYKRGTMWWAKSYERGKPVLRRGKAGGHRRSGYPWLCEPSPQAGESHSNDQCRAGCLEACATPGEGAQEAGRCPGHPHAQTRRATEWGLAAGTIRSCRPNVARRPGSCHPSWLCIWLETLQRSAGVDEGFQDRPP
jgi:hypothetical protein